MSFLKGTRFETYLHGVAQRLGSAARLSYSVIKNALHKRLKVSETSVLDEKSDAIGRLKAFSTPRLCHTCAKNNKDFRYNFLPLVEMV